MEMLDVLDAEGKLTGRVEERVRVHELGLWHRSSHVWIFSDSWVLLQKRSKHKDTMAGLWYGAAAGHISAGQQPEDAARRETLEELGVELGELVPLGTWVVDEPVPERGWQNREIYHVYLSRVSLQPEVRLQQSEVDDVAFVPIEQFEREIADEVLSKGYVPRPGYYAWVLQGMKKLLNS